MLRTYEPASRKAVFSKDATARMVAGKQRMAVRPVKQPKRGDPYTIEELREMYLNEGSPLGSAWAKGPSEYILLAEKLFVNDDDNASYADGTPVTPVLKWNWEKNVLAASWQPKNTCRMRIPIINVEIMRIEDLKERTIREWIGVPYQGDFLKEFDKNYPSNPFSGNPIVYVYFLGTLEHIGGEA